MITYKQIIKASKSFSDAHHILKNFGNGELWQLSDHDQSDNFEYPLMYMVDSPSSPGSKSWVYAFRVYFVSRVQAPKDRDGNPIYFEYTSEKSAMIACAQDFLSYWVQDNNYKMTIDQTLGVTTFIDVQEDNVTGCYVDLRFVVPFTYDSCIIPMDGVPDPDSLNVEIYVNDTLYYTLTPGSSLMLNVIDTAGNPVDATVSGSDLIVPATPECDPVTSTFNTDPLVSTPAGENKAVTVVDSVGASVGTKTTDTANALGVAVADALNFFNGNPIAGAKAEGNKTFSFFNTLGNPLGVVLANTVDEFEAEAADITFTDSNGDVSAVPAGENITATPMVNTGSPYKTGQTTIYGGAGCDGDTQRGVGADWDTLDYLNYFGTTERFTDILGGQDYANDWVIDWSTYRPVTGAFMMVYRIKQSPLVWDTMRTAQPFTVGAYSDCVVPNRRELPILINSELVDSMNYAPLNVSVSGAGTDQLWTITTCPGNTAAAYGWNGQSSNGNVGGIAKSGARAYVLIRWGNVSEL